jgi:cysteine-rich repeat protein
MLVIAASAQDIRRSAPDSSRTGGTEAPKSDSKNVEVTTEKTSRTATVTRVINGKEYTKGSIIGQPVSKTLRVRPNGFTPRINNERIIQGAPFAETDFESPCYTAGAAIGGQGATCESEAWVSVEQDSGTFIAMDEPTVEAIHPGGGAQHMRFKNVEEFPQPTEITCFSPNEGVIAPGQVELHMDIAFSNTGGADITIQPQQPSAGFLTTLMVFAFDGDIIAVDFDTDGVTPIFVDTGSDWIADGAYRNVAIIADNDNQEIIYAYDGNVVFVGPIWAGNSIEEYLVNSDNFQVDTDEFCDIDDVYFGPPSDVCGDAVCGNTEDICTCTDDCGFPTAEVCDDNIDNDCDGDTDCADDDCLLDAACDCITCVDTEGETTDCADPDNHNGGCFSIGQTAFQAITAGVEMCAETGDFDSATNSCNEDDDCGAGETCVANVCSPVDPAGFTFRDTDWFEFTLASATEVSLTIAGEPEGFDLFFVGPDGDFCSDSSVFFGTSFTFDTCGEVVTIPDVPGGGTPFCLGAGTYAIFVAPLGDAVCGMDYTLTLNEDGACTAPVCGDGVQEGFELCDDGNVIGGDGCTATCVNEECGDAILTPDEECDDGNLDDGDGCDSNCTTTACGNGILTAGEACDDGNANDTDQCTNSCVVNCDAPGPGCVGTAEGEPTCFTDYVDNYNAGCNVVPPAFNGPTLADGDVVCGEMGNHDTTTAACTADADCGNCEPFGGTGTCCGNIIPGVCDQAQQVRDTDWYEFVVTVQSGVTWCLEGEAEMVAGFVDHGGAGGPLCAAVEFLDAAEVSSEPCEQVCVTGCFEPGTYVAFASRVGGGTTPCGANYTGTMTIAENDCFEDCNLNGTDDDDEIAGCSGDNCCCDCDEDGIPNECELTLDGAVESQTTTNNIVGGSVACSADGGITTTDNAYARCYDPAADFDLGAVDIGVEATAAPDGTISGILNIWTFATCGAADEPANGLLLHTEPVTIPEASADLTVFRHTLASPVTLTDGAAYVVEFEFTTASGFEEGVEAFFVGSNGDGQSALGLIRSAGCFGGSEVWQDFDTIAGGGVHLVLNIVEVLDNDANMDCIPDDQAGGCVCGGPSCVVTNDCGDDDNDNIRDDVCAHWECVAGSCVDNGRGVPTDMGSQFGGCPSDTFCNIHDRTHALTCFAGTNTCASINIDGSKSFGECGLDGFCNIHDANAALTCFAGTNTCVCGPSPEGPGGPNVVDESGLALLSNKRSTAPGELVEVRAFLTDAVENFQSYQLQTITTGGTSGQLDLVDIRIETRKDYVFAGQDGFDAVNVSKSQMLSGTDAAGQQAAAMGYLATFTYRASADATGTFVVDIAHNEATEDQTFLISGYTNKVDVLGTQPAVITVDTTSKRRASR